MGLRGPRSDSVRTRSIKGRSGDDYELPSKHRSPTWWRARRVAEPAWDAQPAKLFEMGAMTAVELAEKMQFWRKHYDLAHSPDFATSHPFDDLRGQLTEGPQARREWLAWAGIPRSLRRKWDAERKRRAKIIAELAEAAA
jgi:hypothetical protein